MTAKKTITQKQPRKLVRGHTIKNRGFGKSYEKDREWHKKFIQSFARFANVVKACKFAGITTATAYNHKAKYPEFKSEWEQAEKDALDAIESEVWAAAKRGDMNTAKFILSRRNPEKWGDKSTNVLQVTDSMHKVQVEFVKSELEAVERNDALENDLTKEQKH